MVRSRLNVSRLDLVVVQSKSLSTSTASGTAKNASVNSNISAFLSLSLEIGFFEVRLTVIL
jgi:hypothetical protein